MPIPYPENLTPFEPPYTIIAINNWWFSLVWGILGDALERHRWQVTDEEWNTEVQDAVIELMGLQEEMLCDPCGITIQLNADGTFELVLSPEISSTIDEAFITNLTYDDATDSWSFTIGETTYTMPAVQMALPNVDDQPVLPSYPQDNICAATKGAIDYFKTTTLAACAKLLDDWQTFEKSSDFVLAILSVIPGGNFIATPLDNLKDFTVYLGVDVIEDARDNLLNSSNIDLIHEALYCRVRSNGDAITRALFNAWLEEDVATVMDVDPPIIPDKFLVSAFWKDVIGWVTFQSRYSLYSYDEENDCRLLNWCDEDLCVHEDFLASQDGWEIQGTTGTWTVDIGFEDGLRSLGNDRFREISIREEFTAIQFARISFQVDWLNGHEEGGNPNVIDVWVRSGTTWTKRHTFGDITDGQQWLTYEQNLADVNALQLSCTCGSWDENPVDPGGSVTITQLDYCEQPA